MPSKGGALLAALTKFMDAAFNSGNGKGVEEFCERAIKAGMKNLTRVDGRGEPTVRSQIMQTKEAAQQQMQMT
ncbi:hypothetical protein X743_10160 [Mesorhizobium sp. LNHC252B00]|nr:hypothetical protein X743_10160 [Mesorhizobium sp. LNHC252B00]